MGIGKLLTPLSFLWILGYSCLFEWDSENVSNFLVLAVFIGKASSMKYSMTRIKWIIFVLLWSVSIGKASSMKTDNPNRSMILKDIFPRELDFDLKFSLEVIFLEYGFGIASKFWLTVFYRKSFLDKQFRELGNGAYF